MGFRKDGTVDLRKLPDIVERPLMRHGADGLSYQYLNMVPGENREPIAKPLIELDSRLNGRKMLETAIHEALHLACPWMNEAVVTKVARYQAMVLWKMGYRRLSEMD